MMAAMSDDYRRKSDEEIRSLRAEFTAHVDEERPILLVAKQLGTAEQVKARVTFIDSWIEREKDYAKLRKAIIEKTVVGAIWAVILFVAVSLGHEIKNILTEWNVK